MNQTELIQQNLRPLRLDAMPAEVATAYLTTPGTKMTGAFRRTCHYARWSYFVSTNSPKPIARRFSSRPINWLFRQVRRTEQHIKLRVTRKADIVQNIMLPLLAELRRREANIAALHGS